MLAHILVPLGTSEVAESALPYAKNIIRPNGQITLLTVNQHIDQTGWIWLENHPELSASLESSVVLQPRFRMDALEYLKSIAAKIQSSLPTVKVNMLAEIGDPSRVILNMMKTQQFDAIVISAQPRSGLNRFLFGSVAHKVAFSSICPVFVIPAKSLAQNSEPSKEEKLELLNRQEAARSLADLGTFIG